ncbi:FYVE, RhoGEF and PH domain-containing protein 6 [Colletotrichum higginsianum]|uniref:RING-type E3 ubiquitin transferase n=1 Tax=Colletotrichum higginsianum TaxID=80884 RepID=A0A4T0WCJ2_9PEZI|nr:FYVE, RhoGEF and PH domain-containing protein 6 [Colletotrichum higginsianum]
MECSRYFDCPTHVVERQLSDDEAEDGDAGEDEPTVHLQMEDDTAENSSSARLRTIEPAVPDVTSEPRASFAPEPEPTTTDQPTEPANSAQATSARAAVPPVSRAQQSSEERSSPPEFIYPRWQPDAEVTLCPICHIQFSIFVRKHHCRKCGRVVCNACSPHRITIPYQYIVQPPGQPRLAAQRYPSSLISGEGGYADFSNLGGGERVRLCNPCVPDPNTTPPQQPLGSPSQLSPRGSHYRSQSSIGTMSSNAPPPNRFSGYFTSGPSPETYARSRSITHSGSGGPSGSRGHHQSTQNRIMAGTPPTYYPSSSSGYPGSSRYRSMLDVGPSSSSSAAHNRALPPPPPQIAEEDECPVCHRELPSRSLPNFEAVRETHINTCITAHSTYSGTPTGETPQDTVGTPPPLAVRRTGMFPYVATEKDCVDSAECTICLEEFEVGVPMARLECLCRFHRSCISAWFVNHPGRCPVHQHDSFGY